MGKMKGSEIFCKQKFLWYAFTHLCKYNSVTERKLFIFFLSFIFHLIHNECMNTEGYINIYMYLVVISVFADSLGFAAKRKNRFANEKNFSRNFFAFFRISFARKNAKIWNKKANFLRKFV